MKLDEILNKVTGNPGSAFFFTAPFYRSSKSYLFSNPDTILNANNSDEFPKILKEVQYLIDKGYSGYAAISYELGYLLEPGLRRLLNEKTNSALLLFYLFKRGKVTVINSNKIDYSNSRLINQQNNISYFRLNVNKAEYINNVNKIKNYIAEGDTYQVNYTIKAKFHYDGDIPGFFLKGIYNQSARYSALLNLDDKYIISFSPELFFSSHNMNLLALPMKGTIARGKNLREDRNQLQELRNSNKDQAENLMITDLMRNDAGRVSIFGSVKVKELFKIEKYETLFQMVSVIVSRLRPDYKLEDIIMNFFPGGSVTGAPKIRTMEIIRELEKEPRGIYTGALGIFSNKNIVFNIPIRTIVIDKSTGNGEMGIGSGIVWDSVPENEYEETLLKSRFLFSTEAEFEIFETMLIENGEIFLMDLHLKRMQAAAGYFLFRFSMKEAKEKLSRLPGLNNKKKYRLKLLLNKWGIISAELNELKEYRDCFKLVVSEKRTDSNCRYYYFKTSRRELYNQELKRSREKGFDEVLFLNEKNEVCEGSFTNIFIKKDHVWYTPPVSCGLLNGTYREFLLRNRKLYKERVLFINDLKNADEIRMVNSLRKEIPVESVCWEAC